MDMAFILNMHISLLSLCIQLLVIEDDHISSDNDYSEPMNWSDFINHVVKLSVKLA